MDISAPRQNLRIGRDPTGPAVAQHLGKLVAGLRDQGFTVRPLNALHCPLKIGKVIKIDPPALLVRRIQLGGWS